MSSVPSNHPTPSPGGSPQPEPQSQTLYWRSLEQLDNDPHFQEFVAREFPAATMHATQNGVPRRRFLQLMAASISLAGLTGCRRPAAEILPYAKSPEEVVPGLPTFYATTMPRTDGAMGVLVESHEGRPTKIEGNPKHPSRHGVSDAQTQAAILELYDPERMRVVTSDGNVADWRRYDEFASQHFAALRDRAGRGLRLLVADQPSPALRGLMAATANALPEAQWHLHQAVSRQNVRDGARLVSDEPLVPQYHMDRVDVIVALDADPLGTDPQATALTGQFVSKRKVEGEHASMNRLYVVENTYTITGGCADHRLQLKASDVTAYIAALAEALAVWPPSSELRERLEPWIDAGRQRVPSEWINEVAADLQQARGRSLVMAGRRQPPVVHALTQLINEALGNVGQTVEWLRPPHPQLASLQELCDDIRAGAVETLIVLGGNPVYDAPADLEFAELLKQVSHTIRLGLHDDETGSLCNWNLPAAHWLESWGDAEAADGTYSIVQPLIAPLYDGRTALELVAQLIGHDTTESYEIVKQSFEVFTAGTERNESFRRLLHDGLLADSRWPIVAETIDREKICKRVATAIEDQDGLSANVPAENDWEVSFHEDRCLHDGRFANNGWLQEMPDPITKLTWDNAALISPHDAQHLQVQTGDVLRLSCGDRQLDAPVFVLPGQAQRSVSLALGYGRRRVGNVGKGVGVDAYRIRTSDSPEFTTGAKVARGSGHHELACSQDHWSLEGRDLLREQSLDEYRDAPPTGQVTHSEASAQDHNDSAEHTEPLSHGDHAHGHADIVQPPALDGKHQWAMTIDLNACTGCNACVVACQSENNIPIVGKGEVQRGREMHWVRVDRYFAGNPQQPRLVHQPVVCVHCENAPCETVCPVNATVHSPEGLNLQVYNRCIGTRYCSNNCPYKVRRFNWFDYHQRQLDKLYLGPLGPEESPETLQMQKNPDVTVRMRGVMEKCTYCVQRIERGKTAAKLRAGNSNEYALPDSAVTPACAQACPAQAIVFGDSADKTSRVHQMKQDPRHYDLLGELNTKPRTSYLARLRNPNPKMGDS